ncbi:hypothetical protein JTE90_007487 [Oedothorax gibbosus]|uniref:Integrase catalytic domain-containing protein n=1 Tax=Oedothorax gibbosus TaxID=931172 RepID=A0AAV6TPT4_9ARAC|nr:hypothetical protein JTE90_007487 [Oedothorax gibbosus]
MCPAHSTSTRGLSTASGGRALTHEHPRTGPSGKPRVSHYTLPSNACLLLGVRRIRTTSYHPISNGLVERMHRQLKAAIKCHATDRWTDTLPTVSPRDP